MLRHRHLHPGSSGGSGEPTAAGHLRQPAHARQRDGSDDCFGEPAQLPVPAWCQGRVLSGPRQQRDVCSQAAAAASRGGPPTSAHARPAPQIVSAVMSGLGGASAIHAAICITLDVKRGRRDFTGGCQACLLPALSVRHVWRRTGRQALRLHPSHAAMQCMPHG